MLTLIRSLSAISPIPLLKRVAPPLLLGLASTLAFAYDDRVALVIGNDSYPTEPLKNAVNDARAVAKTLSDLGFKVVVKTNADINTMRGAAVEFAKILDGASAAVFYYAGHGIQYRDKNYLVPVDAKLTSEPEIVYNALEVGQILESMDDAKVRHKFIVLDACRNNPFRNVFSSTGLAKIAKVPPGTIISYAAAAGAVALDGDGDNGLYTKNLLKEIRDPSLQAGLMFQRVASNVAQESANRQLPELYSTPLPRGAFFFAERSGASAAASAGMSSDTAAMLDREFWTSVKDSRKAEDFQAYLAQFPSGTFAALARNRIDALKQEKTPALVAAAPASMAPAPAPAAAMVSAPNIAEKPETMPKPSSAAAITSTQGAATVATASPTSSAPAVLVPAAVSTAAKPVAPSTNDAADRLVIASLPSAASETRSIEAKAAPATSIAPAANVVAAIAPEQKTALPVPPPAPRILAGLIEFPDGARYQGEYKEDKDKVKILHGQGEFTSAAFRYQGEFKDGKKQGKGVYVWVSGDRFDGDFADDKPSGRGKWEFASGDKYEGDVVNGVIVGKGVFVARNGDRFEGAFADGRPNGKGTYHFASGDKYEGAMVAGKMSGPGIYTNKAGDRLEAPFADGLAQGKGAYYFANGDRYEGDIQNGALTGKGSYFYSNGLRSEGQYVNGSLKGQGAFYFNDGSWFEGTFEDGLKRAKGISILKDGTKRPAEMVDGAVRIVGG